MEEYFVESKSGYDKFMDFLVFLAVFVVTIFLILEVAANAGVAGLNLTRINEIYFYLNIGVFVIFTLDLIRLRGQASSNMDFLRQNWLDILATIPFGLIAHAGATFEVLKLTRLQKISKIAKFNRASKVSKIAKEFKAASHFKKESDEYKKKHRI